MKGRSSGGLEAVAVESLTGGPAASIFGSSAGGSTGGKDGSLNGSGSMGLGAVAVGREAMGRGFEVSSGVAVAGKLAAEDDRDA